MPKDTAFSFEKPEHSPGFLLWKTTMNWQRLIKKALEPYHISHAQFVIMAVVTWFKENQIEATQVNISNLSSLDKMTVSQALKKLIADKMVIRQENPNDTRAKLVSLTPKGQKLITQLIPLVEGLDNQFFDVINQKDLSKLIAIFNSLVDAH